MPTQNSDDDRLAIILERIAKTTPVGLQILEEVQEMTPELNEIPSSKTLIDIVNDYAFNKGAYNLNPIGWEAYQKRLLSSENVGRWRILFHYRTHTEEQLTAEWEYNEETKKLYPYETQNSPQFWYHEGPIRRKKK